MKKRIVGVLMSVCIVFGLNINANAMVIGTDLNHADTIEIGKEYHFSGDTNVNDNIDFVTPTSYDNYFKINIPKAGKYKLSAKITGAESHEDESREFELRDSSNKTLAGSIRLAYRSNFCKDNGSVVYNLEKGTYYLYAYVGSSISGSFPGNYSTGVLKFINVNNVELNTTTKKMKSGASYNLKLKNAKGTVSWVSGNPSVAKVDKNGKVTAKKSGTAMIYACYDNCTYSCMVTVK